MPAPKVLTMRQRIAAIAAQTAPSMVPVPREEQPQAPPEKEDEVIPDVAELMPNDIKKRLELIRMVDRIGEIGQTVSPLSKEKKKLVEKAKVILGKASIGKAICGDYRVNYYNAPRKFLDPAKLEEAGVSKTTILACYSESASYTLRVTKEGEEEGDE